MGYGIVVRGRLSDPRYVELDEPVTDLRGEVEVILHPPHRSRPLPRRGRRLSTPGSVPLPRPESLRREGIYEERL
jgi:hypothetical protein